MKTLRLMAIVGCLVLAFAAPLAAESAESAKDDEIQFTDLYEQTLQFIEYYETIELTSEDEGEVSVVAELVEVLG